MGNKYTPMIRKLNDGKGWDGLLVKGNRELIVRRTSNHCARELAVTELNKLITEFNRTNGTTVKQIKQEPFFK